MLKGQKKHTDKEQGKTKHEAPRSVNYRATQNKNNFYNSLNPKPMLHSIEELGLKIEGAGGHILSYLGAIACDLEVPFMGKKSIEIGALVLPTTYYSLKVPLIVNFTM